MSEIIKAAEIARIIRCDPCLVRHRMRTGEWKFGRVLPPAKGGRQYRYEATIGEVAKYVDIPREEAERRLKSGRNKT